MKHETMKHETMQDLVIILLTFLLLGKQRLTLTTPGVSHG